MRKDQFKKESDQAILARVKKEMDEPRLAESTRQREGGVNQPPDQFFEASKAPTNSVLMSPRVSPEQKDSNISKETEGDRPKTAKPSLLGTGRWL
jgi:hypothetical protein